MVSLSIIVPLYNKARYVAEALSALVPQLSPVDEIVVVDDVSTDGSAEIAERFAGPQLRVLRLETNGGPATARNAGAAAARGDFLLFFDADDLPSPLLLSALRRAIGEHAKECVFTFGLATQARGERAPPSASEPAGTEVLAPHAFAVSCLRGAPLCTASSTCVRRTTFAAHGGFVPGLRYCEDPEFWARLSARHPIVRIGAVLATYRDVPASLSYGLRSQPGAVDRYVQTLLSLSRSRDDTYHRLAWLMVVKNVVFSLTMNALRPEVLRYLGSVGPEFGPLHLLTLQALARSPRSLLRLPFRWRAWRARRATAPA